MSVYRYLMRMWVDVEILLLLIFGVAWYRGFNGFATFMIFPLLFVTIGMMSKLRRDR